MPGGRPRLYTSAEEVQALIDEYMEENEGQILTMSGLALKLGMCTETLRVYGGEDEFSATIKKARQIVETAWEKALHEKGGSGPIFWLKNNAGWKDKKEHDVNGNLTIHKVERTIVKTDNTNG